MLAITDDASKYTLDDRVRITVDDRHNETIEAGEFFSDIEHTRSGADAGNVRVVLPVEIEVNKSSDLTLNVEDIFGNNRFNWMYSETPDQTNLLVGGQIYVELPILIRVSNSTNVAIDLKDIFGDNQFGWKVETATSSSSQNSDKAIPMTPQTFSRIVGGPFVIDMSFTIEVVDSEVVEIDIEDVLSNSTFSWIGGKNAVCNQLGDEIEIELPIAFQVHRSKSIKINAEDTVGDLIFEWSCGNVINRIGGLVSFHTPAIFNIVDSIDVNIDFEDQASDNIFQWVAQNGSQATEHLGGSFSSLTTSKFRVVNSQQVTIDTEDFFGDNRFVWAVEQDSDSSDLTANPFSVDASVLFEVEGSDEVNLNVEDVYGNNLFVRQPGFLASVFTLSEAEPTILDTVSRDVVNTSDVTIEFASVNQGNRYLIGPVPDNAIDPNNVPTSRSNKN